MEDMYKYDIRQFYIMMAVMKSDCTLQEIESILSMDALTVYNSILLNLKKECYKANGMKDGE